MHVRRELVKGGGGAKEAVDVYQEELASFGGGVLGVG